MVAWTVTTKGLPELLVALSKHCHLGGVFLRIWAMLSPVLGSGSARSLHLHTCTCVYACLHTPMSTHVDAFKGFCPFWPPLSPQWEAAALVLSLLLPSGQ